MSYLYAHEMLTSKICTKPFREEHETRSLLQVLASFIICEQTIQYNEHNGVLLHQTVGVSKSSSSQNASLNCFEATGM